MEALLFLMICMLLVMVLYGFAQTQIRVHHFEEKGYHDEVYRALYET